MNSKMFRKLQGHSRTFVRNHVQKRIDKLLLMFSSDYGCRTVSLILAMVCELGAT